MTNPVYPPESHPTRRWTIYRAPIDHDGIEGLWVQRLTADGAHERYQLPDGIVGEMREWVADCQWLEDSEAIDEYTDEQIIRGVERHYDGGVAAFMIDCLPLPLALLNDVSLGGVR